MMLVHAHLKHVANVFVKQIAHSYSYGASTSKCLRNAFEAAIKELIIFEGQTKMWVVVDDAENAKSVWYKGEDATAEASRLYRSIGVPHGAYEIDLEPKR